MKHALSLLVLAVCGLVVAGCHNPFDDYGNLWVDAGAPACPLGGKWFLCRQSVRLTNQSYPPQGSCDDAEVSVCSTSEQQAEVQAQRLFAPIPSGYTWAGNRCIFTGYPPSPGMLRPTPLDNPDPLCDLGPATPGTCLAGSDDCTSCLNYCCTEYAACTTSGVEAECNALVSYWQGTNPNWMATTESEAAQQLEACFEASMCTGSCGAQMDKIGPDGGGSGGSGAGGSGTGGGTP